MAEPVRIKPEPDVASPMADDELDDAGDLEFFDTNNPDDPLGKLYLTRLPNFVWQAWDSLEDDAEIQIGTVRLWNENGKDKLQLLLKNNLAQHQRLPKEYNLDIADPDVKSTFIFTEQDLPSYAIKNKQKADAMAQGIPSHLLRQKPPPESSEGFDRSKRRFRESRRAIPKKTAIAGRVRHELHCTPVQNEETFQILSMRALEAQQPKKQIRVMSNLPPNGISTDKQFEGFIKTTEKPSKQKKMENKTARWPENQLMDKIIESFQKFTYWSMKALRAEIPQPEAFIREVLDRVAVLHRSGRFANQWALKPEFAPMVQRKGDLPGSETTAPLKQDPGDDSEDEDDGDVKMEDVL